MRIDPPVVIFIAIAALLVASTVAQRTGAYADRKAGRYRVADADRRGPLGPALDVIDRSVAAFSLRSWLGISTLTREERRIIDEQAAAARAEAIRQDRGGPPVAMAPKRIVVAGAPVASMAPVARAARSTVSVELLAAGLGLVVVLGIVVGIWPRDRERAGVLSATGVPAIVSPSPSPSPSVSVEAAPN
jgi:hypothetical protein